MKNDLKIKYLQYLSQKKQDSGFTLIELLVVIIIIGILSAIALPSFLNQASKAKETEAVTNVGAVNRAQQAYRLSNPTFATVISDLELGVGAASGNHYTYGVTSNATSTTITSTPRDSQTVRFVYGLVGVLTDGTTDSIICKASQVSDAGTPPTFVDTRAECVTANTDEVN